MKEQDEPGFPEIDPRRSNLILCVGRKGSGKSVAARAIYHSYPYDKIAVDVNGDADPGSDAEKITAPLPTRFPRSAEGEYKNLHFRADPGSPTYREDLDNAISLALYPQDRRTLVWLDEIGEVTQANHTGPALRRLLMQSRHYNASALMCGPRPIAIDPLCVAQADLIFIYQLPNPSDRKRLAEVMGYPARRLDTELEETRKRGDFWYLLYDARSNSMWRCPPMPVVSDARARPA